MMTDKDILAVLKEIPSLTANGIDTAPNGDAKRSREELLRDVQACNRVLVWLGRMVHQTSPNPYANSYTLKHIAEKEIGYVTNGAFIAAAVHAGFALRYIPNSPNVEFAMTSHSVEMASLVGDALALRNRAERSEAALAAAEAECAEWREDCVRLVPAADANDATRARLGLGKIGEAKP